MRISHRRTLLLYAVCATLALWAQIATAQADTRAPLSPTQRRALLADPTRTFWRAKAPDTVALDVETSRGTFTIELVRGWAPAGVDHFYNLARAGFFDDSRFYRVLPFYIAQFGLAGNPAVAAAWRRRSIRADSVRGSNVRGVVTYAQRTPKDRTTALFINLRDNLSLDSMGFAPIGRIILGLEVADSLYGGYGDLPSMAAPLGNPRRFYGESNRYLDKEFPKLDRIIAIRVRE